MATSIVAAPLLNADPLPSRYTPENHVEESNLKVVRLIQLGEGVHGKTATFEFAGGFIRSIDLDAQTIWHSLFSGIDGADWRRLLKHVAPQSKDLDGTIVVQHGPMSFWTHRSTPRGRHLSSNYFDVPQETYAAGHLTGAKAARELILFLRHYERARQPGRWRALEGEIVECLQQAFALAQDRICGANAPNKGHAAFVFCELVTRYFVTGAANANPAYLDSQVSREERSIAFLRAHDESRRLEIAERMRAVRAAKAAKHQRPLAGGSSQEPAAVQAH